MFKITREELENYEKIGFGKYGTVYKVDSDNAIKVYYDTIVDLIGIEIPNPALKVSSGRLKRIKRRASKVKNTDLPKDIVVLDGYFHGYVLPYYDGKTLDKSRRLSYEDKKRIVLELVKNHQELEDNYIYPMDYHTDNVMIVDGKPKIIDIDDPITRYTLLPNPALSKTCMGRLNEIIQDFYNEFDLSLYGCYTMKRLQRVRPGYSISKEWIKDYIKEKEAIQDYLIINEETDIELLKELLRNHKYRVIYSMKNIDFDETIKIMEQLKENDIELYDFMLEEKPEEFFSDYPVRNKVLVKKDARIIK